MLPSCVLPTASALVVNATHCEDMLYTGSDPYLQRLMWHTRRRSSLCRLQCAQCAHDMASTDLCNVTALAEQKLC